jgi:hypothetical protein
MKLPSEFREVRNTRSLIDTAVLRVSAKHDGFFAEGVKAEKQREQGASTVHDTGLDVLFCISS